MEENILLQFKKIKTFVFDVDGVLTDGNLLLSESGEQLRTMNIRDGYAIQLAIKKKYSIIIISGAKSKQVKTRLKKLGVKNIFIDVANKKIKLDELIEELKLNRKEIIYMGDDMPDLDVMKSVPFSSCPADACSEVRDISKYISPFSGGKGCVRDLIEKVLKLNNHWE